MLNLQKQTVVKRVSNSAVAAQTEILSTTVDCKGMDGVLFIVALGDITATCVLTAVAQGATAVDGTGAADLAGTSVTCTAGASDADNKLFVVEVARPRTRWVRLKLTRTTANAVVDGIIAVSHSGSDQPTTHDASVLGSVFALSPA